MPTSTTSLALALLLLPADVARAASWVMDDTCAEMAIYGLGVADASHAAVGATSASGALPAFYNASTGCTCTGMAVAPVLLGLGAAAAEPPCVGVVRPVAHPCVGVGLPVAPP